MPRTGRPAKPSQIKQLEGNPGKRQLKNGVSGGGAPECPEYLGAHAKAVWRRIIGSMPPSLYAACDQDLLAAYCIAAETHKEAYERLKTDGHIVASESGAPYQSPWESIKNKQAQLMASLGSRLGLDPAARENLSPPADKPKSKFEGLFSIQGGRKE